jgi:endonuclease/exonuclease/phosphatase family metal-dependent hydrolase
VQVLTYNIAGRRGKGQPRYLLDIAALIKNTQADVVGLQEVVHHEGEPNPEEILAAETGMHACFIEAHEGRRLTLGNAILTRDPIVSSTVHELPWRLPERRILLEVETTVEGHSVTVFNTHLIHLSHASRILRRAQAQAVAKRLLVCKNGHVLIGDLNCSPYSGELQCLRQHSGDHKHHKGLRTWPARRPWITYDHIWPGGGLEVVEAKTLDLHISDHRPVLARLRWKK